MIWGGLDLYKKYLTACALDNAGAVVTKTRPKVRGNWPKPPNAAIAPRKDPSEAIKQENRSYTKLGFSTRSTGLGPPATCRRRTTRGRQRSIS